MALDEPKSEDTQANENGIQFMMDKQTTDVLSQGGGLTIDFVDEEYRKGYMLHLGNAAQGDCDSGGCSGCG